MAHTTFFFNRSLGFLCGLDGAVPAENDSSLTSEKYGAGCTNTPSLISRLPKTND
jgi:hypothetical protein